MEINEKFYKKISKEYENFKKITLISSKDEIIDNAFEIVVKSYIKEYLFEQENLTDEQIERLMNIDNLIEYIFNCYIENGEYLDFDKLCSECIKDILKSIVIL